MKRLLQLGATIGLLGLASGCAAPGSGIVQIAITGTLRDATSKPIPGRSIDLCLPKEYGLAGLDAKWGQPENYGHRDQKATVVTSQQGAFTNTFHPVSYSKVFWLLPPLGGFPRHPPEPFVFLRFPPATNEYWSVWAKKEGFDNRVGVPDQRKWLPQSPTLPAKITGTLRQTKGTGDVPQYVIDVTVEFLGEGGQNMGANHDRLGHTRLMHKKRHQSRYAEIINPSAKKYLNQCTLCGRVGLAPSTMETDYDATSGDKTIKEQQKLASLVKSIAIKQLGKQYAPLPLDADGHCEMCANVAIRQKAYRDRDAPCGAPLPHH